MVLTIPERSQQLAQSLVSTREYKNSESVESLRTNMLGFYVIYIFPIVSVAAESDTGDRARVAIQGAESINPDL